MLNSGIGRSIVRDNMLTQHGYTPYCGGERCWANWPRAVFNGRQMECPRCHWQSAFEPEFIEQYKTAQASLAARSPTEQQPKDKP